MAETKQYITQVQEYGSVMISEDVIATIVANAIGEIEGVVGLNGKPAVDISEIIGKKNWGKGVKIVVDPDNTLHIDCNINVVYGQSVVTIAANVQEAVSNALEATTGVKVSDVNVNVCGIVRQ